MKVLIVATPRSGSTNFGRTLAKLLKSTYYHEPFHPKHHNTVIFKPDGTLKDSIVVKTIIEHPIKVQDKLEEISVKEFTKYFDKVILLSRKDIYKSYESYNYIIKQGNLDDWHKEYKYEETDFNVNIYNRYLNWVSNLITLSSEIKVKVTWYEDLYSKKKNIISKIFENWNIPISSEQIDKYFNNGKKYRKETKINLL